jgi:hypothetical protein
MNKNYIIWGISDKGYEDSISSSYPNNVIPAEFKASVSDNHRQYAFTFARENPNGHYFYSIEQVGSNVLYTIFRTNFKGGSTGNRLAYDAATIIISKNHIIEKPLNSLKLLISSYIKQKDSGFGNFNFENALAGIRLLANNDKRSISKRYKAGYIKYHSETELSSVLVDKKDKLHNFNKVYFFTGLRLLEQGENKIQDLKDYKATPIKIINYDARYYRVFVENNEVTPSGNTINAYKGEEIKIYKTKGNTPQNVEIAKAGLTITLKKIETPKPKPQLTGQDIRRKRKAKQKAKMYTVFALCSIMVLVTLGFVFFEKEIQNLVKPPKKVITAPQEKKEIHKVDFNGENFTKLEPECSERDIITNADSLFNFFQESIYFINDSKSYKLFFTADDWKISTDKEEKLKVDALKELKVKIEKANKLAVTKKIVDHINKVIQYNKLCFEAGLEFDKKIWKIKAISRLEENDTIFKDIHKLMFRKSGSNTQKFSNYTKKIKGNKKLETFLDDNLPEDIFNIILENNRKEFKNKEKDDKTIKKTDTRKPDNQVNKPVCRLTEEYKDNGYWHSIRKEIERFDGLDKYKPELDVIVNRELATINSYKLCGCPKCKKALSDPHLKSYIKEFLESYEK